MEIRCPNCEAPLHLDSDAVHKVVICDFCSEPFRPVAPERGGQCPNCGVGLADDAVLCLECGFNRTGDFLQTRVEEEEEAIPSWVVPIRWFVDLFPGVLRPWTVVLWLACLIASVFILNVGLALLAAAPLEAIVILAFAVVIYAQGWTMVLAGTVEWMTRAMNEFEGKHWWAFCIFVFGPFALVIALMMIYGPKLAGG